MSFEDIITAILDRLMTYVIMPLVILGILALVVIIPVACYKTYQDFTAETFSLKKTDWNCTATHSYTTTSTMIVGKAVIPQTTQHNDCVQWTRK